MSKAIADLNARVGEVFPSAVYTPVAPVESEAVALFSKPLLGEGVKYIASESAFEVVLPSGETVTLSLGNAAIRAFFVELFSILHSVHALPTSAAAPIVASFSVSSVGETYTAATGSSAQAAVGLVLARFTNAVAQQVTAAFKSQALVQVVSTHEVPSASETLLHRTARSAAATQQINGGLPILDSTFDFANVPFCTSYQYYCNVDANGISWNQATGCSVSCGDSSNCGDCIWFGCNQNSTGVMPGTQACTSCAFGFVLVDGYCYVDSIYPASFNIVLWLGVMVALALIATCYTIGTIDPGRNTAIYRTGHSKSK